MSRDALVVGVNVYQNLPSLQAPAQDAESVARCLESFGECRVVRLPEAIALQKPIVSQRGLVTTPMLEAALIKLFKPAGKNIPQTAIFYYSGHGLQRQAGIQEGFLATSDANPAAGHYGLSLHWLRRLLQESPVRQRVILLDCCNSGEFFNMLEADPGARAGTDRLFMAAAREYEAAYEAIDSPHSVFTQALLSGLNPYKVKGGIVNGHSLTDQVNRALKGELQQPLFESSGGEIVLTRLSGTPAPVGDSVPPLLNRLQQLRYSFCPFPGAEPFDRAHHEFFFGREEFTQTLIEQVQRSRLCALVGASGAGKTSLLRAGLLPGLTQSGVSPTDVRYLALGDAPLTNLAAGFVDPQVSGLQRAEQLRQAEAFLRQGAEGFCQLVQAWESGQRPGTRLVLVLDQFEALLPLAGEAETAALAGDRQLILACLSAAVQHRHLPLHVVLGVRSHHLEQLADFPALQALVANHSLTVPAMTYNQLKTTIVGPLDKIGLNYDANLIYTLLLDVVNAPADLALLQMVLKELWLRRESSPNGGESPRLTLSAYAALGGVRQLLNQRASDVYQSLSDSEQAMAQRLFLSLCDLGDGTTPSRRQTSLDELVTATMPRSAMLGLVQKLLAARLVVAQASCCALPLATLTSVPGWVPMGPGQLSSVLTAPLPLETGLATTATATFDIAHEALLRHWPLLHEWIQAQGPLVKQQRSIEAAAQEWQQQRRPNHPDYFLSKTRLSEAKTFRRHYPNQLSTVANCYLSACDRQDQLSRRQRYLVRLLIPLSMVTGMATAYGHSYLTRPAPASPLTQAVPAPVKALNQEVVPAFTPAAAMTPSEDTEDTQEGVFDGGARSLGSPQAGVVRTVWINPLAIAPAPVAQPQRRSAPALQAALARSAKGMGPLAIAASALQPAPPAGTPTLAADPGALPVANQVVKLESWWVSPTDPSQMIQIWCTRSPGIEPVCFTSTAARGTEP